MLSGRLRLTYPAFVVWLAFSSTCARAINPPVPANKSVPVLTADGLGKGLVEVDGPWQFHAGDNLGWAAPELDDTGWEQVTADAPIGTQGHPGFTGYGWYRRHINITPAPDASPDVALLLPAVDDVYEIYWNGTPVGHLGSFPPHLSWENFVPPQTYGLGPIRSGVLAVRVYKVTLSSTDDGTAGGFEGVPVLGSPVAIANLKAATDFRWLRRQQFTFGLTSLYGLTAFLALIAWLRNRKQRLLFWMAIYCATPLLQLYLNGIRIELPSEWLTFLIQCAIQFREIAQWFVLVWLLQLYGYERLMRFVRVVAYISLAAGTLDGALSFVISRISDQVVVWVDGALTAFILPFEAMPAILVGYALYRRHRLDSARWTVAVLAATNALYYAVQNVASQYPRYTHWTLANKMVAPLFSFVGSSISVQLILRTLLFLAIVYAVIRYSIDNSRRQSAMEQEFQNARELQQVLIPETLPSIPGFTLTSAYRPAQEVGGDFFQIIPLTSGSTLIVLGDVSGKGLKAAMAVSLIIGTVRALADDYPRPAQLLTQLNRRLFGRMQGGFATCIVLLLNSGQDAGRSCTVASAGHPAPFLNEQELDLSGALPLGLAADTMYEEATFHLQVGDHCALYTDGLLEARSDEGELYGFERLESLFSTRPDAAQATEAAVVFGQEDDITVLTLTRLATGQESTAVFTIPKFAKTTA